MDMYIKTAPNKTAIDNWLKNVNLIKKREPHVPMDMSVKMAQKQNWYQIAALVQKNGNHLNGDDLFLTCPEPRVPHFQRRSPCSVSCCHTAA